MTLGVRLGMIEGALGGDPLLNNAVSRSMTRLGAPL